MFPQNVSPPLRSLLGTFPVMKMLIKVETQSLKQKKLGFKLLSALSSCLEFSLCLARTREKESEGGVV